MFFRTPDLLRSYGQIYRRGALLENLILSFLSSDGFGDLLCILHFISTPCLSDTPVRPLSLLCLSLLRFMCYLFLWRIFCCFPLLFWLFWGSLRLAVKLFRFTIGSLLNQSDRLCFYYESGAYTRVHIFLNCWLFPGLIFLQDVETRPRLSFLLWFSSF